MDIKNSNVTALRLHLSLQHGVKLITNKNLQGEYLKQGNYYCIRKKRQQRELIFENARRLAVMHFKFSDSQIFKSIACTTLNHFITGDTYT